MKGRAVLGNKALRLESKATDRRKRKSKTDFPLHCQLVEGNEKEDEDEKQQ